MKRYQSTKTYLIAPDADVMGDVSIGENCSVFYHAVIRADHEQIIIGNNSNIQDGCVLHVDDGYPISIGENVTVGHGAILHGCTIGNNTLIGMGAIVLNGAIIGDNCIVGAGALVTQNAVIPDGMLAMGSPAKVRRQLTPEEIQSNMDSATEYVECAKEHFE